MQAADPEHHFVAIFDNYSSFAEGDENSAQDTKIDLLPFQELKNYMTVIYIHHRNKAGTGSGINSSSGSGVHGRTCDHTITIDHSEKEPMDRGYTVQINGRKFYGDVTLCYKKSGLFIHDDASQQAYEEKKANTSKASRDQLLSKYPDICALIEEGKSVQTITKKTGKKQAELSALGFVWDKTSKRMMLPPV